MSYARTPVEQTLWADQSDEPPLGPETAATAESYDLAVIGGGLCGLSVALAAADRGLTVVLLDSGSIGSGASGRSGGILVPQFPGTMAPSAVAQRLGDRGTAERLLRIVAEGPAFAFDRIRALGIACGAEQTGWMQPAHSPKALERVRKVHDDWQAFGAAVEWIAGDQVNATLGTAGYLGAWHAASGGTVNPLALARGLARVARATGVHVHEHSPVRRVSEAGGQPRLQLDGRSIAARRVVLATNGYSRGLFADLDRALFSVRLFLTFTQGIGADQARWVMPGRTSFTDSRKSGGFGRFDARDRLMGGGAAIRPGPAAAFGRRHTIRRLRELHPQLGPLSVSHYWEGRCAVTPDYLPVLHRLGREIYAVGGFSSRGMAVSQSLGDAVGRFAAGVGGAADLPLPLVTPEPIPWHGAKSPVSGLVFPVYAAMDRLGMT